MAQSLFKQRRVKKQDVVQSKMFLDQLDDTLSTVGSYLECYRTGNARKDMGKVMASVCATSLNCLAMSSNERHQKGDKRSLTLASQKLKNWSKQQMLSHDEYDAIYPMLKYVACCTEKVIDMERDGLENLDNPDSYGKNFTSENVSKGASQYLESNHVVQDRVTKYTHHAQEVDQEMDAAYASYGGKKAKLFPDYEVPDSNRFYQATVENPRYRLYGRSKKSSSSAPDLMDMFQPESDDDVMMCSQDSHNQINSHDHHSLGRSNKKSSAKKKTKRFHL